MHVRTLFRLMNSHVGSGGVEKFADNPQAESHTLTNARSDEKKRSRDQFASQTCICYFIRDCTGKLYVVIFQITIKLSVTEGEKAQIPVI